MSDREVVAALEAMERMLQQSGPLESKALAEWRKGFDAAVATAERGPGWAEIAGRAHALAGLLDAAAAGMTVQKNALLRRLNLQATGSRALKAYRPG
ncbi:MAG TPA: hypothetical protein VN436_02690 [Holophaga sp.]|nr:hypothetical protein [Holophaga sp.]